MFRAAPSPEETVSCNVVPLLDVAELVRASARGVGEHQEAET